MKIWDIWVMKEFTVWHKTIVIGIGRDIEHFVTKVCRCVKQKRQVLKLSDPLQPTTSASPFDLISIYVLHLDQSSGGYEYITLIVDQFIQGYATQNKTGQAVAEKLFNESIAI